MNNILTNDTILIGGITVAVVFFAIVGLLLLIRLFLFNNKWSLRRIDKMKGAEFEKFMKEVYFLLGYKVEQTKISGDQGIDLIIKKFFKKTGVQLKRYSGKVGNSAVQEAVAGKKYYKLDKVCVLTTSYFTQSAKDLAKANGVELLNRDDLDKLLEKAKKKDK